MKTGTGRFTTRTKGLGTGLIETCFAGVGKVEAGGLTTGTTGSVFRAGSLDAEASASKIASTLEELAAACCA